MAAFLLSAENDAANENSASFFADAQRLGWSLIIAGAGKPWKGFASKLHWYAEALRALPLLPEPPLIILSDSRDVLCLRGPQEFQRAFESFRAPLVVSMEMFCDSILERGANHELEYPHSQCADLADYWRAIEHSQAMSPRQYVNSGLIAGRAPALLHFLDFALQGGYTDDQFALGKYMCAFPQNVAADTGAALLHTSGGGVNNGHVHTFQSSDSPSLAELVGNGAFFLHVPGIGASKGQALYYATCKALLKDGIAHKFAQSKPYKAPWGRSLRMEGPVIYF